MIKIACFLVAFMHIEVLKRSLGSVISEKKRLAENEIKLDIYIIENNSIATKETIEPYLLQLVQEGDIYQYFQFSENIINNAVDAILQNNWFQFDEYDYVILTDGDIEVPLGCIDEQRFILDTCQEVMACALTLDTTSWQVSDDIHNRGIELFKKTQQLRQENMTLPYIPQEGGMWFVMFRSGSIKEIVSFAAINGLRFLDITYRLIIRLIKKKLWVQTKIAIGKELHREGALWSTYESDREVIKQSLIENKWAYKDCNPILFQHNKFCGFTIFSKNDIQSIEPIKLKRFNPIKTDNYTNDSILNDSLIKEMAEKGFHINFTQGIPASIKPSIYIIRKGIGASFFDQKNNALFLQMRGGYSVPPIVKNMFSVVSLNNFLDIFYIHKVSINVNTFLNQAFDLVRPGGYMEINTINWSEILNAICKADEKYLDNLYRYLLKKRILLRSRENKLFQEGNFINAILSVNVFITVDTLKKHFESSYPVHIEEANSSLNDNLYTTSIRIYKLLNNKID